MPLSSRSKSLTAISVRNTPARSTCGGAPGQSSLPSWITRWNYARSCTRQTRSSPSISSYAKSPRTADISRTRTLRSSCCTWGCATSPATEEAIRGREPTTGLWRLTPWRNCSLDGFRCVRISLVAKSPQTYTEIVTGSARQQPRPGVLGEIVGAAAQYSPNPIQRVAAAAPMPARFLLHPATHIIDGRKAQAHHVERIKDPHRIGQPGRQGGAIAAERIQCRHCNCAGPPHPAVQKASPPTPSGSGQVPHQSAGHDVG